MIKYIFQIRIRCMVRCPLFLSLREKQLFYHYSPVQCVQAILNQVPGLLLFCVRPSKLRQALSSTAGASHYSRNYGVVISFVVRSPYSNVSVLVCIVLWLMKQDSVVQTCNPAFQVTRRCFHVESKKLN